jgi:hypothetical protein
LRAAGAAEDATVAMPKSRMLDDVVLPAIADAERSFTALLARLTIEDLARRAEPLGERAR